MPDIVCKDLKMALATRRKLFLVSGNGAQNMGAEMCGTGAFCAAPELKSFVEPSCSTPFE
jgi:hypothetical protein